MSDAERFRRVETLFREAGDLPPDRREAMLDERCGGDAALKAEVLSLLAEEAGPSLVDRPVFAGSLSLHGLAATSGDTPLPKTIGRYRIVRRIGVGGMGVVYEAEQDSPRRTVALKVIHAGLATESRLRRFEHEAEVLGRLQHPGIAHIHEAGTYDNGAGPQPFFAMELVRGEPLARFVVAHALDPRQSLELVARICDAVEHAHQRGVVHRDLKPGNIFVIETPDGPRPKILDFGVARATDADLHATTLHTQAGELIGTIPYMSPEQAAGDPDRIDARSDVYAMGVIAYELLAGRLPYDIREKMVHEAVRVIREDDPTPLSSISRVFAGDVWTIVRKALEKDPDRRYESASAFSADIRRYLRNEPVTARPPSTLYQLGKFARRNKALMAGVVTAFVALLAGTFVATWQAVLATQAHRDAEHVIEALVGMFNSPNPSLEGRDVRVKDVLDASSATVAEDWGDRPRIEARLRAAFGLTYLTLADLDSAAPHIERALEIRRELLGPQHPETLESMHNLVKLRRRQGQDEEAARLLEEVYTQRRRVLGPRAPATLTTMNELGLLRLNEGRIDEAEATLTASLEACRTTLGVLDLTTQHAMTYLARVLAAQGRPNEAEPLFKQSLELRRETLGSHHAQTVNVVVSLARFYLNQGRYEEALPLYEQALEARKTVFGPEHPVTLASSFDLARLFHQVGDYERAEPLYEAALDGQRAVLHPDHPSTLFTMNRLAMMYRDQQRFDEAVALAERTVADTRRTRPADDPYLGMFLFTLGDAQFGLGRHRAARQSLLEARQIFDASEANRSRIPAIDKLLQSIAELNN